MAEEATGKDSRNTDRQNGVAPGSGVTVAALASAGNAVLDVLVIERPAAGQMKIVETAAARLLKFSFDLSSCKITVLDVDAILIFPDGGKIVMPNFALQMVIANPPVMQFDAATVEPHILLARAGDIKLIDQLPEFALSDTARPDAKSETAQPASQVVQVTATQQYGHTPGPQSRPFVIDGTGNGNSLSETNGRYAKKVDSEESQGSSLKGEGALTENSQKTAAAAASTTTTTTVQNTTPKFTSAAAFSHDENGTLVTTLTATDADAGSVLTYAVVGGPDSDRFSVNSATGKLYFVANPDFEAAGSSVGSNTYQIIVAVSDGTASATQTLTIALGNVNEAPDSIAISAFGVDEGSITGSVVGTVTGRDPDAGALLTYSFAPGGDAGGRFAIDVSTGAISVLRGDLIDFEASQSQLIVVRATDQAGLYLDRAIVISVNDANDAPVITSNGGGSSAAITVSENITALTTVSATDADAGSVVTYSIVGGSDAGSFVIDSITGVLSFVSSIDFEVPGDANGDNIYNVVVQASDGLGGVDQQVLAIAVVNANDPPENLVLSANTVVENAANGTVVGILSASDPDANAVLTYSFVPGGDAGGRFAINAVTGELSVLDGTRLDFESNPTQTIIVRVTDQGGLSTDRAFVINLTDVNEAPSIVSEGGGATAAFSVSEGSPLATSVSAVDPESAPLVYSIVGGADAARFTINSMTGALTFIAAPDFEAPGDADADNVYQVTVQASDGTFTDTQALSITVTDTGEAPVIVSNSGGASASASVLEGTTFVTVVLATDPDAGSTLSYSISGGADAARFTINALTGALSLVVPPDFENPTDADGNNIYDVVVQVSDGVLTDTQAIQVTVLNQNDAPVIVSDGGNTTATVAAIENGTFVTTVTAVDPDIGSVLIYTISGGGDASRFTINSSTGVLTFIAAPDFEAPMDAGGDNIYDVQVQVLDGVGGVDTQSISVNVINQNEAPVIVSNGGGPTASVAIQENTTAISTVVATDADTGAILTYSILGGADAARFVIDAATGVLTFVSAPDFDVPGDAGGNNVYDVVVQVSDGLGGVDQQAIAVTVTNVNEAPSITSNGGGATAALSFQESGAVVTTVMASDPDAATTLTYTIVGGADAGKFNINPTTGVLTFVTPPDFEAPGDAGGDNIYDVTVQVSDGSGGFDTQAIAVSITNQNEAPVIVSNGGGPTAAAGVQENSTAVATVLATDADAGAVLTYSIFGGADAAKFIINATTGALAFIAPPDFESPSDSDGNNIYDVIVLVSDGLGGVDTQAIAISVTNQNETPSITSNGGGATAGVTIQENGTAVTSVTASDPDAATTLIYTIVGGADSAKFTINPANGVLTFIAAPDFEAPGDVGGNNVYDVVVQVSDGLGGLDTQAIAVTIVNQNEAPIITSNGGGATAAVSVAENSTAVTTVVSTDVDAGATRTFSIIGGADAALFTINASTGALAFISGRNFEAPSDVGANNVYDVTVQVSDGLGGIDTQAIAVTITNVNEAPVITSNGGGATASISRAENSTTVTTVTSTDPDAGATKTFSIIGGVDAAKFTVNPATGVLTFVTAPNFETPTDSGLNNVYDVTVQVSDSLGGIDTQAIAVTVTNINEAPDITSNGGAATAAVSLAENGTAVTTVTAVDPDAGAVLTYSISGGADAAKFTINASTGVLTFIAAPDFDSPGDSGANNVYDVTIQVSDGLGGTDTQAIAVTITNINEAPVITSNGGGASASISLAENAAAVTTVTSVDPDAGATKTFVIIGGADASKFTISPTTGVLAFLTPPNFEAPADSNLDNIYDVVVEVSDGLGGIDTQAIAVTVTNANEPPEITSNGGAATAAISLSEGATAVTTVMALDPDTGAVLTYSISGGADAAKFTINASTGVLTFITAPDFESPGDSGANNVYDIVIQVSDGIGGIDTQAIAVTITNVNEAPVITSNGGGASALISLTENGTNVTTATSTDPDAGAALSYSILGGADASRFTIDAATGVLTFLAPPDFETPGDVGANNVYDIIVQVSDGLGGIDTQAIAVTISNANEPPDITSNGGAATAAISLLENVTAVTTVTAIDADLGAVLTYSIAGGADAAKFAINASTGALTLISAPDFENPGDAGANNVYDVIVQVSDGLGGIDTQAVAVTITDANDSAPTITSNGGGPMASMSVSENATAVTTVIAADPDTVGTITYSIAGGADAALFAINAATGVLTFISAPDHETPADAGANNIYDVVVRASDGINTDDQSIAVTVTNQNEAPAISSNGGGSTASITLVENGTTITTVFASDPDAGAMLTYSIAGGADAGKFTINAATGVLTLASAPDFEAPADNGGDNIYDVVVLVSDGLGGLDTQAITVTVTNANEAPVITSNGGGPTAAVLVAENTTAVTTVTAADVDAGATLSFSISGGADAALFAINAATGLLSFLAGPDYEGVTDADSNGVYEVIVQVSDGLGETYTQAISVSVANANEAPVITSDGGGATSSLSIQENATVVTTVAASDPDAATTITYSIQGGADQALFSINAATGVLTFLSAPDFENPTDAGGDSIYNVVVRASDGLLADDQAIAVTITNASGVFSGTVGADVISGTSEEDFITGLAGNDTLSGGLGNDTIDGGAEEDNIYGGDGSDTLEGGTGYDNLRYDGDTVGVVVSLATNTASGVGSQAEGDVISGFEAVIGGSGADSLTGNGGANFLHGNNGNDTISGGGGNDQLVGSFGDDTLIGGAGDDILDGGSGNDVFIEGIGDGDNIFLGGSGADTILGSANGSNIGISGDFGAANSIEAISGDAFTGVSIHGDANANTLDFSGVTLTNIAQIDAGDGNDTVIGSAGADNIVDSLGDDSLAGGGGDDTLDGGAGNDTLDGSGSNVIGLFGGSGDDLLMLDTAALEQAGTMADGGANYDTVVLRDNGVANPILEAGLDIVGKLNGIERIDATGANVVVDFSNATAADIRSILGLSGPTGSGALTLDLDGNDSFSVAGGQFFTQAANLTTFFSDAAMTNEIARVLVV
jgi:Cadherin domain/RTX calcium-binding nonapeptide repeat (4 copies)